MVCSLHCRVYTHTHTYIYIVVVFSKKHWCGATQNQPCSPNSSSLPELVCNFPTRERKKFNAWRHWLLWHHACQATWQAMKKRLLPKRNGNAQNQNGSKKLRVPLCYVAIWPSFSVTVVNLAWTKLALSVSNSVSWDIQDSVIQLTARAHLSHGMLGKHYVVDVSHHSPPESAALSATRAPKPRVDTSTPLAPNPSSHPAPDGGWFF